MRIGLLLCGLFGGVLATFLAVRLGAGLGAAALFYAVASTLSVLGGALFWANRPQVLRPKRLPAARPPPPHARHLAQARHQADARDWSAAA